MVLSGLPFVIGGPFLLWCVKCHSSLQFGWGSVVLKWSYYLWLDCFILYFNKFIVVFTSYQVIYGWWLSIMLRTWEVKIVQEIRETCGVYCQFANKLVIDFIIQNMRGRHLSGWRRHLELLEILGQVHSIWLTYVSNFDCIQELISLDIRTVVHYRIQLILVILLTKFGSSLTLFVKGRVYQRLATLTNRCVCLYIGTFPQIPWAIIIFTNKLLIYVLRIILSYWTRSAVITVGGVLIIVLLDECV